MHSVLPKQRTATALAALGVALHLSACGAGEVSPADGFGIGADPAGIGIATDLAGNVQPVSPGVGVEQLAATDAAGHHAQLVRVSYAAYDGQKAALFADTATVFELTSYVIKTNRLLELTQVDGQLSVKNWVPRNLENVVIVASHNGEQFPVAVIDHLPGLQRTTLPLPWKVAGGRFRSATGAVVDLSAVDPAAITFGFSPQDEVQQAIADIKLEWTLEFPDRVMLGTADVCRDANVVWRPTRPQDGRYVLSFLIRAAQAVSHPKFHELWMKTAFINWSGPNAAGDALTRAEFDGYTEQEKAQYDLAALDAGQYYNKAHRQAVFGRYFVKRFAVGMTGGGGLGGGATLGLNHSSMFEGAWGYNEAAAAAFERGEWYLEDAFGTPWNIFGHEAGHALGFGHNSSYSVRAPNSHVAVGTIVYSWLLKTGKAIVTPETMVGRDPSWEADYDKTAPAEQRSRPTCGNAFEWGGSYGRHELQLPLKGSPEWTAYLEAHRNGNGLQYLQSLAGN